MSLPRLATDDQLQRIYDGALDTLESVGLLVQDDELKHLMLAAGCADGPDGQVQIPRALVEEMLAPRRAHNNILTLLYIIPLSRVGAHSGEGGGTPGSARRLGLWDTKWGHSQKVCAPT